MCKISRRTLLASVLLSNGTPALPLAKLNGILVAVFARRIKLGMSPDDAAKIPVDGPARTLGASKALPDDPGEKIGPVAYLDERAGFTMRRISERLRAVVVETAGDERIAVASNGSMYLVRRKTIRLTAGGSQPMPTYPRTGLRRK